MVGKEANMTLRRVGFTLVEMLVVVVVILILAGMTISIMAYVNTRTGRARAAADIERIKNALEEYYAVYGIYPPVEGMRREFAGEGPPYVPPAPPRGGAGYRDGLVSYLFLDSQRSRWDKYLDGWPDSGVILKSGQSATDFGTMAWSNLVWTIKDPWERDYIYRSRPPYQSYELYSQGLRTDTTNDDIGIKWVE